MPTFLFRPVRRDRITPAGGTERDFRSKTIGQSATGQVKRGSVFADRLPRTARPYKRG